MADSLLVRTLTIEDRDEAVILFGPRDQHLRALRDAFAVKATYPGGELRVEGTVAAVEPESLAFGLARVLPEHPDAVLILDADCALSAGALLDAVLPMLDATAPREEEDAPEAEKPWSPI